MIGKLLAILWKCTGFQARGFGNGVGFGWREQVAAAVDGCLGETAAAKYVRGMKKSVLTPG